MTNVLSKSDQSLTKRPLLPFLIRVIQNLSIAYGESNPRKTHSFRGREKRRGSKAENTYDYYYVTTVVAFSLFLLLALSFCRLYVRGSPHRVYGKERKI